MRSLCTTRKGTPNSSQLEKVCTQWSQKKGSQKKTQPKKKKIIFQGSDELPPLLLLIFSLTRQSDFILSSVSTAVVCTSVHPLFNSTFYYGGLCICMFYPQEGGPVLMPLFPFLPQLVQVVSLLILALNWIHTRDFTKGQVVCPLGLRSAVCFKKPVLTA